MAIKIVVTNEEDKTIATRAVRLLKDMLNNDVIEEQLDSEYDGRYVEGAKEFVEEVEITQDASNLDTALLQEIGKAYRFEYDKAKAAGDEKLAERHLGSMLAIKRIIDMAQPPEY